MQKTETRPARWRGKGFVATLLAFCLLVLVSASALAATPGIKDDAGVLDAKKVQDAGSKIKYQVNVYTMKNFQGDSAAFQAQAISHTKNDPKLIVIALNTEPQNERRIAVTAGKQVPLSDPEATAVRQAFIDRFASNGGDYTDAVVASLQKLEPAVASAPATTNRQPAQSNQQSGGGFSFLWCLVGLLVIGGIAMFAFSRSRKRSGGGMFGSFGRHGQGGYGQSHYRHDSDDLSHRPYPGNYPPGQYPPGGYPQGHYPPGSYPPGQYPDQRRGGGMNPWVAGGLGAAAGGLIGYGLGHQAGQNDQAADQGGVDASEYGGSSVGDFGGGDGGDFGGGDFGGGDF